MSTPKPDQALAGIRCIDLTSGPAGGLATMMLADFGAEVLRIVHPSVHDPLEDLPAAPMWHRGKESLALDLNEPADLAQLHKLCAGADVFVSTWRPGALTQKQLAPEQLAQSHPHLVVCHLSGYGYQGPLAEVPCYEHSVAALTGRMQLFQGLVDREGPVFSALQVATHACAQSALSGILAALYARDSRELQRNLGATVRTSLLQGLLAYEQGAMLGAQFSQTHPEQVPSAPPLPAEPPPASLYYHPAQAGDGRWMQFGNLMPHLFDNFLVATDLIDIIADPDFDPKQMLFPEPKHEAFRERMLKQIASRTSEEWMAEMIANGQVVAGVYQTTQQALADPDIVANGHALPRDNGVQLGPVARLTATPANPGPDLQPATDRVEAWTNSPRKAPTEQRGKDLPNDLPPDLPLKGVRVLEIATIIAAPFAASLLADLGAEVTKVEQMGGDPYRGLLAGVGSARVNAGKRSLSVNLKSPEGKAIVLKLAANADILIHNYRPGVPERLGIDYNSIKAINPNIVYLQCNGYGPDGPGADRPSTHPIPGAAMGGVLYQLGERVPSTPQPIDELRLWTRRLMRANEVNPDPNTAVVIASAALLGLVSRNTTGSGQKVLVDMFGANAYANHDDFLNYTGKAPRSQPDENLYGLNATYRLYRCADERWVFLAMSKRSEHQRFIAALESAQPPATFTHELTAEKLSEASLTLANELEALFVQADAKAWETLLTRHRVSCLCADAHEPQEFWLQHEQAQAMNLTTAARHPAWGDYQRHGAMVSFDNRHSTISKESAAAPLPGQHNRELLTECGYSSSEIDALIANHTIWAEPE